MNQLCPHRNTDSVRAPIKLNQTHGLVYGCGSVQSHVTGVKMRITLASIFYCLTTVVLPSVHGLPLRAPSTQKKCRMSPGKISAT